MGFINWILQSVGTTKSRITAIEEGIREHQNYIEAYKKIITKHQNYIDRLQSKLEEMRWKK